MGYLGVLNGLLFLCHLSQNRAEYPRNLVVSETIYTFALVNSCESRLNKFRDVYLLTTAADNDPETPKRAETGLGGWIACYPKSRLAGTLFCGGIGEPKAIEGNEMLQKAFELGKSI
jgi:hypothetical protein